MLLLLGRRRLVVKWLPSEVAYDHLLDEWSRGAARTKLGLDREEAKATVLLTRSRQRGRMFAGAWVWAWCKEEAERDMDGVEVGTGGQGEAWHGSNVL